MTTKRKNRVHEIIQANIYDEKDDIKEYRDGAKKVPPQVAKVFRSIAKDETEHKKRLLRLAKKY